MAKVIANGRITNAKGDFAAGDEISGPETDLQPLVDSGAARWPEDEPGWTLATPPDEYLERYPDGPNADAARRVLENEAEGE